MTSGSTFSGIFEGGEGETVGTGFSGFSEVAARGYCRLVKAMRHGRWWMLKGLKEECRSQSRYRELLRKEFEIGVAMQHPGIVQVSGHEEVEGLGPCIVMEWVDGEALSSAVNPAGGKPLPRKERRRIFGELLDAVEYIHSRQVVHRDLKPSNILLTRNGRHVKIIDFGFSDTDSHAMFKQPAGTRGYISPEQLAGSAPDQRNDIYSLGCILRNLDLGWAVRRVVKRCLLPMESRYRNVGELRRAFRQARLIPYYIIAALCIVAAAPVFALYENPAPTFPQATIDEGRQAVDEWVAATGMAQRMDTLTDFKYIEQDYIKLQDDCDAFIHDYAKGDIDVELRLRLYFADKYVHPWADRIGALNN